MTESNENRDRFVKPVRVVIDGREITAEAGAPLLQVALDNGVEIPHYCYHPKLSIDGSCRMCQVKIEKAPKLAIACNTPVADGMVVDTKAAEVVDARKGVMELLLVNHPLDCPICDQAGECYLQDYSFGHGRTESRSTSPRRKGVKRFSIGPRVVFDQERCILCRRCVRFTKEISRTDELRVFGAGDRSRIATSADRPLDNAYSINTADICPVGALLSADFHHKRRVWFLEETESVCPTCSNGCNVKIGAFKNEIQRLVPRRNDEVNDTWMCDHGRLNYAFVQDDTRLRGAIVAGREAKAAVRPAGLIDYTRDADGRVATPSGPSVDEAIAAAAASLRAAIATYGASSVAVVLSPTLTNEETLLLGRLVRDEIKTPHLALAIPLGLSDDFLIKPEKVANARGARDVGIAPGEGGLDLPGILAACASGDIKVLWVIGSGDLLAVAGLDAVEPAVGKLEALLLQDTNLSSLTDRATVVIPGCAWAEKDGSMTNHAGRVQRIRPALRPPAGLVADGEIFARLASALRGESANATFEPRAAFAELAKAVPSYGGLEWSSLGSRGLAAGQGA
ncbi:MAG: 2Fe-2S iron-sulfur cluster-binding protein [Deltaproteobacteria bacterium]